MKKLAIAAVLLAALGARAEESVTNELQEASATIVWGFGNYGFYSGYQLYGSILNPDPVLQGYIEVNVNLPFAIGPLDDLGYLGAGYWCNSDLTGRRNVAYRRAFNENDPNVHWDKTFWFDEERTWGLEYRTWFMWYCFPRTGGRDPVNRFTMDWNHAFSLVNPYLIPYIVAVHEYRVTDANLIEFGIRKPWQITDEFSVTPFIELVWRDERYGWCFANYGLDENGDMIPAGFATLKLELDATYMFTKNIGIFAKVAYCQNIDPDLRDASDLAGQDPDGDVYGLYNEFVWGGVGISVSF